MKIKKIWPILLIVIIITTAAGLIIFNSTDAARFRKQLNLGQRYLSEMNYEEAVVAFNQAIEIDPRSVDAYLGLADAYIGLGDEEAALAVLKKGYEATGDERLKEWIDAAVTNQEKDVESRNTVNTEDLSKDLKVSEETADYQIALTGTVYKTEEYCDDIPSPELTKNVTYASYCFVLNEDQAIELESETYTLSLFGIDDYLIDENLTLEENAERILAQEITVGANLKSFDSYDKKINPEHKMIHYEIAPVYLDLVEFLEGKTEKE